MNYWGAGFSFALEINRPVINRVADKFIEALKLKLSYSGKIGKIGFIEAKLANVEITDLDDPVPIGGVVTDLLIEASFKIKLFGIRLINTRVVLTINDVEIDLAKTPSGLPKGISMGVLISSAVKVSFPGAKLLAGWLLNSAISPIVNFGIWLAFSLFKGKRIDIPIWELVEQMGALGIRYEKDSPVLTAQKALTPNSLLLGADFSLANANPGNKQELNHFIPDDTDVGLVIHEKVLSAAVQLAFSKGYMPSKFKIGIFKVYINTIKVSFEPNKIRVKGKLKAKAGNCWCRVKARIHYNAAIEPRLKDAQTKPALFFNYDAHATTHVSTSGILTVLGVIIYAPFFQGISIALTSLLNIAVKWFLPYSIKHEKMPDALSMKITAMTAHFSGFFPLFMYMPLKLSGNGSFDLAGFREFNLADLESLDLPVDELKLNVGYTDKTISIKEEEMRFAIGVN